MKLRKVQKQDKKRKVLETVPELQQGLNVVKCGRGSAVIHRIALEHLSRNRGQLKWVDSGNQAVSRIFRKVKPRDVSLSRVRVARAFTAYQHYRLMEKVEGADQVVLPLVNHLYEDSEVGYWDGMEMLESGLENLDGTVLASVSGDSDQACLVESMADNVVEVKRTGSGVNISSDGFETPFYRTHGEIQTTLTHWREVTGLG
jgi:hypothetical protein